MSVWDDPEEKINKKIRKCARNAALSVGIGIGLLLLKTFYPDQEGAEKVTEIFGALGWCLTLYGIVVLATVIMKQNWALRVNALLTWIVLPAYVVYVFVRMG